jgi:hypothetical protein
LLALGQSHKDSADSLYQQHQEIDGRLVNVSTTADLAQARQWLLEAINTSRAHFRHEESCVFPLLEEAAGPEMLLRLGRIWRQRRGTAFPERSPKRVTYESDSRS